MCEESSSRLAIVNPARAQRLRELVSALQLDAILLITGWDACYSLGCKAVVEWLCDVAGAPGGGARAAALEEGVFVATPDDLSFFVDHDAALDALDRLLTPSAAAEPPPVDAMQISPRESEGDDPLAAPPGGAAAQQPPGAAAGDADVQPDGKLSLLLELHPRCRRVGVPLGVEVRGGVQQPIDASSIHRWPLLMALAEHLDVGMELLYEEVRDITPSLRALLGTADGTLLYNTLRTRRPLLTRAWLEVMAVCGRRSATPKLALTEAGVAAPLTEFVSGCACRLKPGQYQPLALPPRALFGQRTSQSEVLSDPGTSLLSQAAVQGGAVLHATLEAADACSPLRVARTVFFGQGAGAPDQPLQLLLQGRLPAGPDAAGADAGGCGAASGGSSSSGSPPPGGPAACRCNSSSANNTAGSSAAAAVVAAAAEAVPERCGSRAAGAQQQPAQCACAALPALAQGRALLGGDHDVDHRDLFDLMCWYWAAVDAAWQGMEHFATADGATWESTQAHATSVFWSAAAAAQLLLPPPPLQQQPGCEQQQQPSEQQQQQGQPALPVQQTPGCPHGAWQRPQLRLQLFSWDGGPRPMPSTAAVEQHDMRFKTLRVQVCGITSRSPAHPGLLLGSALYMDTFLDVPRLGGAPAQLINLTLTHCPTYSFNFWGSEASSNTHLVGAFRRHLQLQLQAQAEAQARAALRRSVDEPAVRQLQQELRTASGSAGAAQGKGAPRRSSLGQQQQLLLLQQLAGSAAPNQQQRQQLLLQLQAKKQAKASAAASTQPVDTPQPPAQPGSKHGLAPSCCGEGASPDSDGNNAGHAIKRSCCGSGQGSGSGSGSGAGSLTVARASLTPSPPPSSQQLLPLLQQLSPRQQLDGAQASASAEAAALASAAAAASLQRLGQLLVPAGEMPGEVALIFTGAMKLAVMDGPLYPHTRGLVFVSRPTKVHTLPLEQIEAVWLQDLGVPAGQAGSCPDTPLGPCVVIQGRQPACGLLPAMHMTDNFHVAIPLRTMSKACSQHWVTGVLPAWQAAAGIVKSSKAASAPWPLPAAFQPFYAYWLRGARKRYMVPHADEVIEVLVQLLDLPGPAQQ